MSLKHFHIAFVTVCVLFCAGLGAWCLLAERLPGMYRTMGWISLAGAVAMLVYGVCFYKKIRKIVH